MLHNICATNSEQSSELDRTLAQSLEFILKDNYGNDTVFPDDCHIIAYLNRLNEERPEFLNTSLIRNIPLFVDPTTELFNICILLFSVLY